MSKPKSNSLFHFTKSLDSLKSILTEGLHPRYCLEDTSWINYSKNPNNEHVAYPIVCFCDIPLSRINEHTDFYGSYGIGLSKEWGLKNDLNPVIYCTNSGLVTDLSNYIASKIHEDESDIPTKEAFWKLMKLVKPITGNMIISGASVEKDFYQENEWRYTPVDDITETILFLNEFEKKKDNKNNEIKKCKLEFSPSDIKYVFVKKDSDIPGVIDLINNSLAHYPLNDLKILSSRILSLHTIEADL